jgi:2-succinyl-6-hydroxy-2,4-cyclohexadiene-1-carboxylate synthase
LPTEVLAPAADRRGRRLVLVHGFTQTGRSWWPVATALADAGHEVAMVDAPGHGAASGVRADLPQGAQLLAAAGGRATYVGYSMGARLCLHLALARPDLTEALVLIGATAGIADPTERAARRRADEDLAATLDRPPVDEASPEARRRLDAFLADWLARPLFATLDPAAAGLDDRRRNSCAGLAASLRLAGTGTQAPLWDPLAGLPVPTLVLAGALDTKFAALGRALAAAIGPAAQLALVEGAGHAAHLERPASVVALVARFLEACDRAA